MTTSMVSYWSGISKSPSMTFPSSRYPNEIATEQHIEIGLYDRIFKYVLIHIVDIYISAIFLRSL